MSDVTNFEGTSHEQLFAMVAKTNPAIVLSRGTQLESAGRVLKELSQALKSHIGNITWEGKAAESFKTWANNLQQSAELLGNYSAGAGGAMNQAGEALSLAKAAVPAVPTADKATVSTRENQVVDPQALTNASFTPEGQTTANIDKIMTRRRAASGGPAWVSDTDYQAAKQRVDKAYQDAVHQMEKLGQAYVAATDQLTGLGNSVVLPGTPDASRDKGSASDYSTGGSSGGYGGSVRASRSSSGSAGGSYSPSAGSYGGGSVMPREPGTSWQELPTSGHNGSIPPHGGGQLPPAPQDPGSSIPPSHPADPVNRPGTSLDSIPTLPDQTVPVGPGSGPVLPSGPSGTPTYPGGPEGPGGLPGLPGSGPIAGFPSGTGGGSVPTKGTSGGSIPGRGGGSIPARTGPFGGGPVPGKSGTPGLPSGTVFGREGVPGGGRVGGTPMGGGMGMHPGMGGGHGVVGGGGGSRGRGLTSTPGGTVGGRKGPAAGGEFTPGGTGLRNRAAAAGAAEGGARSGQNGMMAPGMGGHGSRNERDRRSRADYLHEDEETWTSGTPQSNPDVIE